jgi:hypothetical protein
MDKEQKDFFERVKRFTAENARNLKHYKLHMAIIINHPKKVGVFGRILVKMLSSLGYTTDIQYRNLK